MQTSPPPRRTDVQGLRALASLLVASYHIWFGGVSGGVDVFFALGGYLLAASLLRQTERDGRIGVRRSLWSQVQRLFPMAAIVLVVTGTITLVPSGPLHLNAVLGDLLAAATFTENWRLVDTGTAYVDAGLDKSFVQHFWAMGVQGQFTAACILAAALVAALLGARARQRMRVALGATLVAVAVGSFAYALVRVAEAPEAAYFDTGARAWQLALGGATYLLVARVRIPTLLRVALATAGVALVLTAGLLPRE